MTRFSNLIDTFIIFICLVTASYSANLFLNSTYHAPILGGERINLGKVFNLHNEVRRRSFDNFSWHNLSSSEALFHNDRIFTDKNSSAQIEFESGNIVKVSEESLFKITKERDGINLNIEQGIVIADLNNASESFIVRVGGQTFEIKSSNSKIKITTNGDTKELAVLSGSAKVSYAGKETTVDSGREVTLSSSSLEVKESWLQEFSPLDAKVVYLQEGMNLEINARGARAIMVSNEISKLDSAKLTPIEDQRHTIESIKEGTYYWRASNEEYISDIKSFEVRFEKKPEFLSVEEGRVIYGLLGEPLYFQVEELNEISVILNGEETKEFDYESGELELNLNEVGHYLLSFKEYSREHPYALESDKVKLQILDRPNKATLVRPFKGEEYFFYSPGSVELKWDGLESINALRTTIVVNENEIDVRGNRYLLNVKESGEYQWSVRYYLGDELVRESEVREFKVAFDRDISELKNGRKIVVKKPGDIIDLTWKENEGEEYLVEVSSSRKFSDISETIVTKDTNTKFKIKKLGTYYWRVKNNSGTYARPVKIIVVPPPPPKQPKIKKIKHRVYHRPLLYKVLEFFIPTAHAAEGIILDWEQIADVKQYRVQIWERGTKKILVDTKVERNQFTWWQFKKGIFKWRVSAIDFWEQEGEFSPFEDLVIEEKFGGADGVKLLSPAHKATFDKDEVIKLKFEKVTGDEFYIEVSKDRYFSSIRSYQVKGDSFELKNALDQGFYWRVKVVEKGDAIYSKMRRVDIKKVKEPIENKVVAKKAMPKDKKRPWSVKLSPGITTYTSYSNGKEIVVDDTDFLAVEISRSLQVRGIDSEFSLQVAGGKVFEDIPFNRISFLMNNKYRYKGIFFELDTVVVYRDELTYENSEIVASRDIGLSLRPGISYRYGPFEAKVSTQFLSYSGLSASLKYHINSKYQISIEHEDIESSKYDSFYKNTSVGISYSF